MFIVGELDNYESGLMMENLKDFLNKYDVEHFLKHQAMYPETLSLTSSTIWSEVLSLEFLYIF